MPPESLYKGVIDRYRSYLPVDGNYLITLDEGNTPLLPAPRLAEKIAPGIQLYLKLEGLNPTGSFKDRGMTYAISKALERGSKAVVCASTGNTSASAAAYAARAGVPCIVVIPAGKIAYGKLAQAMIHGARIVQIRGNFDQALEIVRKVADRPGYALVNSVNPDRITGQMSAAFEICDALGQAPEFHALPVGNAGNITSYWRGYTKYLNNKIINSRPRMLGFQAKGASPLVTGRPCKNPETVATAIRIGNPASWKGAIAARDESEGLIEAVTDKEILDAYRMIAYLAGYFCEPASAAGIAGIRKLAKRGYFPSGATVVCTLTGHGLKDPDRAIQMAKKPVTVRAELAAVTKALKL